MAGAAKKTAQTKAEAEAQLKSFIAKFEAKHQKIIREARQNLRRQLPGTNEIVYDNYNFFVIGYSPSERPSDTYVSIAAAANGVVLSFYHGATVPDPHKILLGSGNQNRFLRLDSAEVLDRAEVQALIAAAVAQGKPSEQEHGGLMIRLIAPKQRPRRKTV
jgi:hypothetical protein